MWPFTNRKSTSKEQTAPFVAPAEFRGQLDAFIAKNGLERPSGNVCMQAEQTKKMLVGIGQYAAAAVSTNADDVLASAIELVVCWVIAAGTL